MSINRNVLTLDEFTLQQLRQFPTATGELSRLLRDMALAAKRVNVEVNKAGLVDILGDIRQDLEEFSDLEECGITYDNWFSERSLSDNHTVERAIEKLKAQGHTYEQNGALWFRSSSFGDEKDRVLVRENGLIYFIKFF